MRALMSFEPGGPETLRLVDTPKPIPGTAQVQVEVKACGVNYPDFLTIQDRYQVKTPRPFAPGAEVAGIVSSIGRGTSDFRVGQRVAARIGTGGMAEFVVADVSRCSVIPEGMSFADAAVMQFTFETAYYALSNRAQLKAGETVLVLGAGGGLGIASVGGAQSRRARHCGGVFPGEGRLCLPARGQRWPRISLYGARRSPRGGRANEGLGRPARC